MRPSRHDVSTKPQIWSLVQVPWAVLIVTGLGLAYAADREEARPTVLVHEDAANSQPALDASADALQKQRYFARLEAAFAREPIDAAWNPGPELATKLTKALPRGALLDSVRCRSIMCRVQTSHETSENYREYARGFSRPQGAPLWTGPVVFADIQTQVGVTGKIVGVVYLGRQSQPDPTRE